MNLMIKSLMYITIAMFMGSCSKTIVPVVDFTPRLKTEIDQADLDKFSFKTQSAKVQNFWNGGDFVNQGNSNFTIDKFSHKFENLSLKLPYKIITDPLINNNQIFILDEKNNLLSYDLKENKIQWKISLKTDSAKKIVVGGLSIDDQRLYVINGSRNIYIIDRVSGYKIGQILLEDAIFSPVAIDDKNIYALVANNNLLAFDKTTLNNVWHLQGQSMISICY
jgi:outer membrane protein assembly factor BamB